MSLSIFVHDAQTLTHKIPGAAGLYPPVVIKYRPAAPAIRFRYTETPAGERLGVAAEIVCERLQSLAVNGDRVTLRPDDALKMHADLFTAVFNAVMGYVSPSELTDQGTTMEGQEKNSGSA